MARKMKINLHCPTCQLKQVLLLDEPQEFMPGSFICTKCRNVALMFVVKENKEDEVMDGKRNSD